jgi:hypothetical protein
MTVAFSPVTVADSIAEINISGVTIKSLENIPQSGTLIMPVLFPQPNGFISDIEVSRESFGGGTTAAMNFMYTLHYVFLFSELGSGLSQLDPYSPLIEKLETIWEKIAETDTVTGLVDMQLAGVETLGQVEDPSGNQYWGALFSLRCLEYAQ